MMVESSRFVALQSARSVASDSIGIAATTSSMQQHGQPLANLGNRDGRSPFIPRRASQTKNHVAINESRVVKKLGPPVTAARLMGWKREWAAISVDVEKARFQARASAGQDVWLLGR